MSDAEIIVLRTGYDPDGDEAVVTRKREPLASCIHRQVSIDKKRHVLVCRRCDAEVDPLDWISLLASDWQWYSTRVEQAKHRAEEAERRADGRIKAAQRSARTTLPMPVGKRLGGIAGSIGRAHGELALASVALAEVHDTGNAPLADHYLEAAEFHIKRARSSFAKLVRDYGRRPGDHSRHSEGAA